MLATANSWLVHLCKLLIAIARDRTESIYELGAHGPTITPEDIELTHRLWLKLSRPNEDVHHNEVISVALERLAHELAAPGVEDRAV